MLLIISMFLKIRNGMKIMLTIYTLHVCFKKNYVWFWYGLFSYWTFVCVGINVQVTVHYVYHIFLSVRNWLYLKMYEVIFQCMSNCMLDYIITLDWVFIYSFKFKCFSLEVGFIQIFWYDKHNIKSQRVVIEW